MSSIDNIQLGACSVTFDGVDLGLTKGGVEINIQTDTQKFTVDYFNKTVIREYIVNRIATVTTPLSESSFENFKVMFAGAIHYNDGTTEKVVVNNATGTLLNDFTAQMILHPLSLPVDDKSQDVTFPICYPKGNTSFSFKYDEEKVYSLEFTVLHNTTTGVLFVVGDPDTSETEVVSFGQYDFSSTNNGILVTTL